MGATLHIASQKGSYTLTDRATFFRLKNLLGLDVLVQGDESLLNIYHVIEINPEKWSKVNIAGAKALSAFLTSLETREILNNFGTDAYGEQLFFPPVEKNENAM